jgi:uncharacterized membrane protein HdeD (DUF308 family)
MAKKIKEKYKELAIAGYVIAIISLFVYPVLGILSIIFGAIVIANNPKYEGMPKLAWKTTRGQGMASLCVGIIDIIWLFFQLIQIQ